MGSSNARATIRIVWGLAGVYSTNGRETRSKRYDEVWIPAPTHLYFQCHVFRHSRSTWLKHGSNMAQRWLKDIVKMARRTWPVVAHVAHVDEDTTRAGGVEHAVPAPMVDAWHDPMVDAWHDATESGFASHCIMPTYIMPTYIMPVRSMLVCRMPACM